MKPADKSKRKKRKKLSWTHEQNDERGYERITIIVTSIKAGFAEGATRENGTRGETSKRRDAETDRKR